MSMHAGRGTHTNSVSVGSFSLSRRSVSSSISDDASEVCKNVTHVIGWSCTKVSQERGVESHDDLVTSWKMVRVMVTQRPFIDARRSLLCHFPTFNYSPPFLPPLLLTFQLRGAFVFHSERHAPSRTQQHTLIHSSPALSPHRALQEATHKGRKHVEEKPRKMMA